MTRTTTIVILLSIALILTLYTASAYFVASEVYEVNGSLWWPNTAAYGQSVFYPWPYVPAGGYGQMLTELTQADVQYYQYVIKSGILIVLSVLAWIAFLWKTRQYYLNHKATGRATAPSTAADPKSNAPQSQPTNPTFASS